MFQAILALFGCKKSPSVSTVSNEIGPFTIDLITTKGKTWNMNSGRVNYTHLSYDVQYKGQPLTFDHLETNTALPGIWRVFHLPEASVQALLLGSQSQYLVTEEDGKTNIKPLHQQSSDFASIQWLDSENGQPGDYREIYSSDPYDTEMELSGGRFMAISHAMVFDTRTFELFPFNTNNEPVEEYTVHQRNAVGFSPDSTQVVYCGYRQNPADYMLNHLARVCFGFKQGKAYAVPFDKTATYLKDESKITNEWVADFFEWTSMEGNTLRLTAKVFEVPPPRKGVLLHERHKGNTLTLEPVKASMMDHLLDFIKTQYSLDTTQAYQIEGDYLSRYYLKIGDTMYHLIYGEFGSDLVLKVDPQSQVSTTNKETVLKIAQGFNAMLEKGTFRDEWIMDEASEE